MAFRTLSAPLALALAAALLLAPAPAAAQEFPAIELGEAQSARLAELVAAADAIDKFTDPLAYQQAYRDVVAYAATIYPEPHPELEILKAEIAFADFMLGNFEELPGNMRHAIAVYERAGPAYRQQLIESVNNLAVITDALGDSAGAIGYQRQAVELWREDAPPEGSAVLATGLGNLAWSEYGLGNFEQALAISDEALAMAERLLPTHPDDEQLIDAFATNANNRVIILFNLGRQRDAEDFMRRAVARTGELLGADHQRVATMMLTGATMLINSGKYAEAEQMARAALLVRENTFGAESGNAAEARLNLISALMAQGRHAEALTLAEYTVRVLTETRGGGAVMTLDGRAKLANIYLALGRTGEGLQTAEAVLQNYRDNREPGHPDIAYHAWTLAMDYARTGRWEDTFPLLDELEAGWTGTRNEFGREYAMLLALRAAAEGRMGNPGNARAYLDRARPALVFHWRQQVEGEGAQGGIDRALDWGLGWAAMAADLSGDAETSFELAQYVGIGASERALLLARQRDATSDAALAAALRERQDLLEQREALLASFGQAASAGDTASVMETVAAIEALDTAIASYDISEAPLLEPENLDSLQAGMDKAQALLFIVETDLAARLYVVTADGLVADTALGSPRRIAGLVERLRASIDAGIASGADYDLATAQELQAMIFTPRIAAALQGREEVSVIARGQLSKLPFSVLVDDAGDYLIARHAFSYPIDPAGFAAGLAAGGDAGALGFSSFLGVGAPALPGPEPVQLAFRGPENSLRVLGLGQLGMAEDELRQVSAALGVEQSRILVGAEATEQSVRAVDESAAGVLADLRADMLMFATHGLMAGELSGLDEAALVLSPPREGELAASFNDGLLTTSEISELDINARWVVLSACNSASGDGEGVEAFGGLAQAFLYAGADSLLASHWRVRDDAAARLTLATAQGTAAGLSPAQALRQAKLALMQDEAVPLGSHPAIWAPFVFVGS